MPDCCVFDSSGFDNLRFSCVYSVDFVVCRYFVFGYCVPVGGTWLLNCCWCYYNAGICVFLDVVFVACLGLVFLVFCLFWIAV